MKIRTGEGHLKGGSGAFVVALECQKALFQFGEGRKIVGCEDLPLDDTTYCPSSPVIRGDMAIFLMRGAFNQFLPAGTPVIM